MGTEVDFKSWCQESELHCDLGDPVGTTPCRPLAAEHDTTVFDFVIPARSTGKWNLMDVVYQRVAGLDIHKRIIVPCRIVPGEGFQVQREVRSFGTTTSAIEQLADWLTEAGVTHVAMEATGVYWKPLTICWRTA